MKIIEDGVFWFISKDGNENDCFYGLEDDYVMRVEKAYADRCSSIRNLSNLRKDRDYITIAEGKTITTAYQPRRSYMARELRVNNSYKNHVRGLHSAASREFRREVNRFHITLRRMLAAYFGNSLDINLFRRKSADLFVDIYRKAWELGKKASGQKKVSTSKDDKWFRSAVKEELSFWQSFITALSEENKRKALKVSVYDRIAMYVDTTWFMFNTARVVNMPAAVLLFWYPEKKKTKMCPGCSYMVKHNPFTRDTMPTVPRAGDTPCLSRCVHKVIVRNVSPEVVKKRERELPNKESMIRALRSFMGGKQRRERKVGRAWNPFGGRVL